MAQPNQQALANGAPTITLAGQQWPVPLLAIRQNKIIVPALQRLFKMLGAKEGGTGYLAVNDLSNEAFDNLIAIVHSALSRAHPELTLNEFQDMPIATHELLESLAVISNQTGVFAPSPLAPTPGTTASPLNGTQSSPISATA